MTPFTGGLEIAKTTVLEYDRQHIADFFDIYGEDLSTMSWSQTKKKLFDTYGEKAFDVVKDLQTFVLTVAKNRGEYENLEIKEDVLGFTGEDNNGIDEKYGTLTHEALYTILDAIKPEGIRTILQKGATESESGTPIMISGSDAKEKFQVEQKFREINIALEQLGEVESDINIAEKKRLEALKHEIEASIEQGTTIEQVITRNTVTGYTKLVIERVYIDYTQALEEINKVDPHLGKKIQKDAQEKYYAYRGTDAGKEKLQSLQDEGNMTEEEAKEVLKKQFEIETLHYYVHEADDEITLLEAVQAFEKIYKKWHDGLLAYKRGGETENMTPYRNTDLVRDMEIHFSTNSSLKNFIQTPGTLHFTHISLGDLLVMQAGERQKWYRTLKSRIDIPVDVSVEDITDITDDELEALLPFSLQLQQKLETYTSRQTHKMALIGTTYNLQQAFSGSAVGGVPLYQDETIDFSFNDMKIEQDRVSNSFEYQGRALAYTVSPSGDIHIEPTGIVGLHWFTEDMGIHIDGPGVEELLEHMQGISRDYQAILNSEQGSEEYIQTQLASEMEEVMLSYPVDVGQQEDLHRDVEFYTFAEHIYFGNEEPKDTGSKIVGGDDVHDMQSFFNQCYHGVDGNRLSVEDFSLANTLLTNDVFKHFVSTLDVSLWKFLSDVGLVGDMSAGLRAGSEQFRLGRKFLRNIVVDSTPSTLEKRQKDLAMFADTYGDRGDNGEIFSSKYKYMFDIK